MSEVIEVCFSEPLTRSAQLLIGRLPFDNVELGRLRWRAANFVRCMIRARAQIEPNFMSVADYERWELDGLGTNEWSVERLLRMALQSISEINEKYLGWWGSGGVSVDAENPLQELKELIGFFTDHQSTLPNAIAAAIVGNPIDWSALADWESLPAIRAELDKLPRLDEVLQTPPVGPDPTGSKIRWNGREKQLGKKLFDLATYLWHSQCVSKQELVGNIWPEKGGDVQLSTYLTRLNTVLLELEVPWSYHINGDHVLKDSYKSGSSL